MSDDKDFYLLTKKLTTDLYKPGKTTKLQRCFKEAIKKVKHTIDKELKPPYEERAGNDGFWYHPGGPA